MTVQRAGDGLRTVEYAVAEGRIEVIDAHGEWDESRDTLHRWVRLDAIYSILAALRATPPADDTLLRRALELMAYGWEAEAARRKANPADSLTRGRKPVGRRHLAPARRCSSIPDPFRVTCRSRRAGAVSRIGERLSGATGSTVSLDERMKGCECPEPHTYGDDVIVRLLRTLRTARLNPNEEISAVGMFVRAWLDMRKDGLWRR